MNWQGAKLSEKPVVIYDGKSSPKYYEFIVKNESGIGIGTITTCIKKEANAVISHVLPYVRDYSAFTSKGDSYKMISGGYPSRIYAGILGKSGDKPLSIVDPSTSTIVPSVLNEDAQGTIDAINRLSEDQKANIGIHNSDSLISEIRKSDQIMQEYAKAYWELMDSLASNMNQTTDEQIILAVNSSKGFDTGISFDEYIIPAFNNQNLKNTHWDGWCGPSALAWIYRGLYSSYNGTYLPLAGENGFDNSTNAAIYRYTAGNEGYYYFGSSSDDDNDKRINSLDSDWLYSQSIKADGGLYSTLAGVGGLYLWPAISRDQNGPTLPFALRLALTTVTIGKYFIGVPFILPGLTNSGHIHMRTWRLPVLCLVNNFSHYVVAFGSRTRNYNWAWWAKVFGKKIIISSGSVLTDKWLYVTDNGYTANNGPYWRNDAFISLDVQYGVYRAF